MNYFITISFQKSRGFSKKLFYLCPLDVALLKAIVRKRNEYKELLTKL